MTAHLSSIELDDSTGRAPPPEIEQEQRVAIFDLLEENRFALPDGPGGPYRLRLGHSKGKLTFDLSTDAGGDAASFTVSLGPLRQVTKDYAQICESYYEAIKSRAPAEVEALDDARRNIHIEGARLLIERMEGKALLDEATARRLFTLIFAMLSSL